MSTTVTAGQPNVHIQNERRYRPLNAGAFHILTTLAAPSVSNPDRQRPPLDLSFIVDRSGSMSGGALQLARQGVEHALHLLDERDSISLVVYDDAIDTLLTQRRCDGEARAKATRRLRRIHARGSTDLAGGWLTGCDQLAPLADGSRTSRSGSQKPLYRALLLTDGLANVGITDGAEIATHASELARRGITTSTFGVGAHYDEKLLGAMADAGHGHFHHIADASAIPQVFAGELGEMLQVAMRDASVALRVPSGWRPHVLNDLPLDLREGWYVVRLGDVSSNELRALTWAIDLPAAADGTREEIEVRIRWTTPDGTHTHEHAVRHSVEAHGDPGEANGEVQEQIATMWGARVRAEALQMNKRGDFAAAQQLVEEALARMPDTPAGQEVAAALRHEIMPAMSMPMSAEDMKRHYSQSRNTQRQRRDYSAQ
jgi:Ca-activated chloride channel homolog